MKSSESLAPALMPWKLRLVLVCMQVLVMVDSAQAGRTLQEALEPKVLETPRRLQAYDPENPGHAPPVQSFLVSDGSWVDCVPIEGQIAAHHPSLKDHIIQMAPSNPPRRASSRKSNSDGYCHPQLFAREHGGCPDGSIPVLRDDPMSQVIQNPRPDPVLYRADGGSSTQSIDPAATVSKHEYAVTGLPMVEQAYSGAHSIFSVNGPTLATENDMTLSQIWVTDGSYSDNSLCTIEVGWQTQPVLHPNDAPDAPHLFIFWTNDAYANTGPGSCYNLFNCSGFVQQNNAWVIGGVMPAYTTLAENAQTEDEVEIEVLYDSSSMNWWLYLDSVAIGYWPASLYNGKLAGTANKIQWGGEVAFQRDTTVTTHTTLCMGSGAFPSAGYPVAAYHRNITYADATGSILDADPTVLNNGRIFDNPSCYDIQVQLNSYTNWGTYFFFGGSGGSNPDCHY